METVVNIDYCMLTVGSRVIAEVLLKVNEVNFETFESRTFDKVVQDDGETAL